MISQAIANYIISICHARLINFDKFRRKFILTQGTPNQTMFTVEKQPLSPRVIFAGTPEMEVQRFPRVSSAQVLVSATITYDDGTILNFKHAVNTTTRLLLEHKDNNPYSAAWKASYYGTTLDVRL